MKVSDALRRIKRQFGDEYNTVISDQDIYDWIHDSELDIIRATSDNDLTIPVSVSKFPLLIPDRVNIKRLSIGGKSLMNISLAQIDLTGGKTSTKGGVSYWYYQGGMAYLWPTPEATDTTTVEVTYARTPSQMTVIAPYLQFIAGSTTIQAATVPSDNDWKSATSVNVAMEIAVDKFIYPGYILLSAGADLAPVNNHFEIMYVYPYSFSISVSNGTVLSTHVIPMLKPLIAGEVIQIRITFDSATDTMYLYKINPDTGDHVLQGQDSLNRVWNMQTTSAADLFIGNSNLTAATSTPTIARIYSIEMRSGYNVNPADPPIIFLMDGMNDLGNLFGPSTSIVTSSAHTMTTQGGIVVPAINEFTVPEVFHEDVVKFCLARAHVKNQNFRAAESEMEQYDRRVSTRRNEAQAPETALYKVPDPADYEDYVQ